MNKNKSAKIILSMFLILSFQNLLAQKSKYADGRPSAHQRIACVDEGVVMRYGDGTDSCDTYGAREAILNKIDDTYYLFYDGAGKTGWLACLAESKDLKVWKKKGAILTLGDSTKADHKSASSPWVIKENGQWHMFYLGTPNTSPAPDRVPSFPYLTMKATATSLEGPWKKQYDVTPFPVKKDSYYSQTSSPGYIIKYHGEYLQYFSASAQQETGTKRTLGLARTKNLNASWSVASEPLFPQTEQVENSSVYYDKSSKTWYLFTNHIGINTEGSEYTDAIWVYWSKNPKKWNIRNKAVVLDSTNCTWAKGAIGMPTVIQVGNKLAMLYDGAEGNSISHMRRNIGLAWISLPIQVKPGKSK